MKRISQSKAELETHLREHLDFLNRSAFYYDEGAISEAKRIATSIRVLLHNTEKSHSLLDQLDMKSISFLNTSVEYNSVNKEFFAHRGQLSSVLEDFKTIIITDVSHLIITSVIFFPSIMLDSSLVQKIQIFVKII